MQRRHAAGQSARETGVLHVDRMLRPDLSRIGIRVFVDVRVQASSPVYGVGKLPICECGSMIPGVTHRPAASIIVAPSGAASPAPTAVLFRRPVIRRCFRDAARCHRGSLRRESACASREWLVRTRISRGRGYWICGSRLGVFSAALLCAAAAPVFSGSAAVGAQPPMGDTDCDYASPPEPKRGRSADRRISRAPGNAANSCW